jgi:nitrous oxidase accessory protein NosD
VTHKSAIGTYGTSYTVDSIESIGGASAVTLSCIPCCPFEGNSGTITNSRIEGATIGAILVYCTADTIIANNEFIDNEWSVAADPKIEDAVTGMIIEDNTMTGGFVGVFFWAGADSIIRDNTIQGMHTGVYLNSDMWCPDPPDDTCFFSTGNLVSGNEVTGNVIDLRHHPNALGNTWSDNICETWEGSEIPGCIAP